jgi:DNA-binding NtrC family response regulator
MMPTEILIVDDDPAMRKALTVVLNAQGYRVTAAPNGAEALACLERTTFDVVITDFRMPGMTGMELLQEIKRRAPETEVILMTASTQSPLDAVQLGAYDYIVKAPGCVGRKLLTTIAQAVEHRRERMNGQREPTNV